ncbi:hypothetical protein D9756_007072 [Leucocoprinus leucothites]|uniref:Phenazine biosynthesis PhzC/PhzF protein n=1 Tax=Leucocoprinus leucothites TaxID=201217 RepID=A0A8H5D6A7_9AGAR|nr:hypothetical protein D9756_007072 [Leucoagaricus leucothites]
MPETRLPFQVIDVFTKTRYVGDPIAIVRVPATGSTLLTQEQKQLIAREFNLAETVFMHDNAPDASPDTPVKIDIFTPEKELPFAGNPTVGASWYLLTKSGGRRKDVTLTTKAGKVPAILQDSGRVRLQVPVDFKEHNPIQLAWLKSAQPDLQVMDYASGADGAETVASIVKGMTFVLLRLNSEDALSRFKGHAGKIEVPWLGEWQGLVGLYAFYEREDGVVRTRVFFGTIEHPAAGSAASTLAGWLGKRKGPGKWNFEIVQGVEVGRRSEIEVQVEVGSDGEVNKMELGGEAVEVMEGSIAV